ncbi:MAG TPA: transcription antitermination factor NusB [Longimicrobiaceae bacterium]|nr:transcription antitermination factor NusB [Longimicrobiaceae bacterium]
MKARSRARGWALQALYAWEMRGGGADALVPVLQGLYTHLNVSSQNRLFADVLVRIVARDLERIDRVLERHLSNWKLDRLSVVDRNILRLGVAEMLYVDDVPLRVTIQEMVRLADRYGTLESPRFVNGLLDAVMRRVESGAVAELA